MPNLSSGHLDLLSHFGFLDLALLVHVLDLLLGLHIPFHLQHKHHLFVELHISKASNLAHSPPGAGSLAGMIFFQDLAWDPRGELRDFCMLLSSTLHSAHLTIFHFSSLSYFFHHPDLSDHSFSSSLQLHQINLSLDLVQHPPRCRTWTVNVFPPVPQWIIIFFRSIWMPITNLILGSARQQHVFVKPCCYFVSPLPASPASSATPECPGATPASFRHPLELLPFEFPFVFGLPFEIFSASKAQRRLQSQPLAPSRSNMTAWPTKQQIIYKLQVRSGVLSPIFCAPPCATSFFVRGFLRAFGALLFFLLSQNFRTCPGNARAHSPPHAWTQADTISTPLPKNPGKGEALTKSTMGSDVHGHNAGMAGMQCHGEGFSQYEGKHAGSGWRMGCNVQGKLRGSNIQCKCQKCTRETKTHIGRPPLTGLGGTVFSSEKTVQRGGKRQRRGREPYHQCQ